MSEEKMKSEELKKVAGGTSGNDDSPNGKLDLSKLGLRTKTRKCKVCGKDYQAYDGPMSVRYTDKDWYYDGMCPECAKTHPYQSPIEKIIEYNKENH